MKMSMDTRMESSDYDDYAKAAEARAFEHLDRVKSWEFGATLVELVTRKLDEETRFTVTEEEILKLTGTGDYRAAMEAINSFSALVREAIDRERGAGKAASDNASFTRDRLTDDAAPED
jgi:hypothetical protein